MNAGHSMNRRGSLLLLLAAVLLAPACPTRAESNAPSASGLEGLVSEWVTLRGEIAAEKRNWAEAKARWAEETRVLETEKAALEQTLAETRASAAAAEAERARMSDRKADLDRVLDGLRPTLAEAEANAMRWQPRIPAALAERLKDAFARIPTSPEAAAAMPVTRRAQLLVALYTEIEALQHGVHVTREVLGAGGDRRREVDAVYLGLARAFAVSPDGEWAAVGVPGPGGWTWSARPELAPEVRRAIAVVNRQTPAEMVALPLEASQAPAGGSPGAGDAGGKPE